MTACCETMTDQIKRWAIKMCPEHEIECPDLVIIPLKGGQVGIPIRDGGKSALAISFCPWCGCPPTEEAWHAKSMERLQSADQEQNQKNDQDDKEDTH